MSTTVGDAAWPAVPVTAPIVIGGGGGIPAVIDSSGGLANI